MSDANQRPCFQEEVRAYELLERLMQELGINFINAEEGAFGLRRALVSGERGKRMTDGVHDTRLLLLGPDDPMLVHGYGAEFCLQLLGGKERYNELLIAVAFGLDKDSGTSHWSLSVRTDTMVDIYNGPIPQLEVPMSLNQENPTASTQEVTEQTALTLVRQLVEFHRSA